MDDKKFVAKATNFEGPLDVLLDLVEKRKMHISDVSLSDVADDFVLYVKSLENYSMPHVTQFIVIASTLVLIKSRALLPTLALTTEEQSDIKDLEDRLKKLAIAREAAKILGVQYNKTPLYSREAPSPIIPVFSPDESINNKSVFEAIASVINNIPIKEYVPKVIVKKVVSIEEMIDRLTDRVQRALSTSFHQFTGPKAEKVTVIVSFLALLELVKQGAIAVNQHEHFKDITIESQSVTIPTIS